jgi:hypothetical protein
MMFRRTVDPHCSSCFGRGEVTETVEMSDGIRINSFTCHCVEYFHDDEMKAFLAEVTELR